MYSQAALTQNHVSSMQTASSCNLIRRWLVKFAVWLRSFRVQSRWVQATILFTDITGFTATLAHLPRYRQQQVLAGLTGEYYRLLRQCVRDSGGRVDKFIGDGMMAVFDDPNHAVRAARRIQECVARFNSQQKQCGEPAFPTRTAVSSGWVICQNLGRFGRRDQTYLGNAVNTASHLTEIGQAGQVLISRSTFDQVAVTAEFNRWQPTDEDGKGDGIIAYELNDNVS